MKAVDRILGEAKVRPPTKRELTDPEQAFNYALDVIKGRWPEAEAIIATDPYWSYWYAMHVIKGRWPEAEEAIATSLWAYHYARYVIKDRWPEGEEAIAKSPSHAYNYAMHVIKGRWPEAEEAIANSNNRDVYLKLFPDAKDDWAMNGWIDWLDT